MKSRIQEKYNTEFVPKLVEQFSYKNVNEVPRLDKITLSMGIGKAIELGVIGSDQDLLVDYFPALDRSKLVAGADKIRIRDLLSMRSGIRVDEKKLSRREKVGRNLEVTSLTLSAPIKPGKEYKYQGTDPNLLSHLILSLIHI